MSASAIQHGHDLLLQGFTVSQVVHDYGDVCQAITELAVETDAPISTEDFRMLNRCLDDAIAGAVTQFGREKNQSTLDEENARGNVRLGFRAHELRNLINTAIVAFEVLKTGNVGVAGITGAVLQRSLLGLRAVTARSLEEVRLTQGVENRERFLVSGFIEELASTATLNANARGINLVVLPVEDGVAIEADRQVLGAVVGNLLQNAFKFTAQVRLSLFRLSRASTACSSRSRMNAAASRVEASTSSSDRSSSAALIEAVWVWASRSAKGVSRRTMAGSTRGTCRIVDASSPWTCRGLQLPLSPWFSRSCGAPRHRPAPRALRTPRRHGILNHSHERLCTNGPGRAERRPSMRKAKRAPTRKPAVQIDWADVQKQRVAYKPGTVPNDAIRRLCGQDHAHSNV